MRTQFESAPHTPSEAIRQLDRTLAACEREGGVRRIRLRSDVRHALLRHRLTGVAGGRHDAAERPIVGRCHNIPVVADETLRDPGYAVE